MRTFPPALDRLMAKVRSEPGPLPTACLVSSAAPNGNGYAVMRYLGRREYVHRVAYQELVGPIASGMTIDHLCMNRLCVNPDHLELVSQRVNILRGNSPGALAVRTNHCKRGHDLAEYAYYRPDGKGRNCRLCIATRGSR